MLCNQCPRRCNALRTEKENIGGVCRMPETAHIARAALHFWEEPSISGTNGSGTVFFSGCSLHCAFCQNNDISLKNKGRAVSSATLAEIFKRLEGEGAHNINLVTPTHYVHSILKPNLWISAVKRPFAWASSMSTMISASLARSSSARRWPPSAAANTMTRKSPSVWANTLATAVSPIIALSFGKHWMMPATAMFRS